MKLTEELAREHASLSRVGLAFLEHVLGRSEYLHRSHYAALDQEHSFLQYPLQSWPTFVKREWIDEMARLTVGICNLIKSIPWRIFHNDIQEISRFYGIGSSDAYLVATVLENPAWIRSAVARGDFVLTRSGLRCIEFNMSSSLGGWKQSKWIQLYLSVPAIAEFVERIEGGFSSTNTVRMLFQHFAEEALQSGVSDGSEMNVAFVRPAEMRGPASWRRFANEMLQETLRNQGLRGQVEIGEYRDIEEQGGLVFLRGKRIHALVEHYQGLLTPAIFRSWMMGRVNVYNGPSSVVLGDKRNLALLSELEGSDLFDEREREIIRQAIPWTRRVEGTDDAETTWRGERIPLRKLLLTEQNSLVLKPGGGFGGQGVTLGSRVRREEWTETVETAFRQGGWVVQEYIESADYLYQSGASGCAPHGLVWGLFAFGDRYGGGFMRMLPKGAGCGIINSAQGASEGVILEVES